jgi:hypothetical protein
MKERILGNNLPSSFDQAGRKKWLFKLFGVKGSGNLTARIMGDRYSPTNQETLAVNEKIQAIFNKIAEAKNLGRLLDEIEKGDKNLEFLFDRVDFDVVKDGVRQKWTVRDMFMELIGKNPEDLMKGSAIIPLSEEERAKILGNNETSTNGNGREKPETIESVANFIIKIVEDELDKKINQPVEIGSIIEEQLNKFSLKKTLLMDTLTNKLQKYLTNSEYKAEVMDQHSRYVNVKYFEFVLPKHSVATIKITDINDVKSIFLRFDPIENIVTYLPHILYQKTGLLKITKLSQTAPSKPRPPVVPPTPLAVAIPPNNPPEVGGLGMPRNAETITILNDLTGGKFSVEKWEDYCSGLSAEEKDKWLKTIKPNETLPEKLKNAVDEAHLRCAKVFLESDEATVGSNLTLGREQLNNYDSYLQHVNGNYARIMGENPLLDMWYDLKRNYKSTQDEVKGTTTFTKSDQNLPSWMNNRNGGGRETNASPEERLKYTKFTNIDLHQTKDGKKFIADTDTAFIKRGQQYNDVSHIYQYFKDGDRIVFFAEKEREGIYRNRRIVTKDGNPWGFLGILIDTEGYIINKSREEEILNQRNSAPTQHGVTTRMEPKIETTEQNIQQIMEGFADTPRTEENLKTVLVGLGINNEMKQMHITSLLNMLKEDVKKYRAEYNESIDKIDNSEKGFIHKAMGSISKMYDDADRFQASNHLKNKVNSIDVDINNSLIKVFVSIPKKELRYTKEETIYNLIDWWMGDMKSNNHYDKFA